MDREVIVTEGVFSKLSITLNQDVVNKLAVIEKSSNPLAKVEQKLIKALTQFEKDYAKAVRSKYIKGEDNG